MAHFALLDDNNIVTYVTVIADSDAPTEEAGIAFIKAMWDSDSNMPGTDTVWKQTSYNTFAGKHRYRGTPFRKNYGNIGFTYDASRDAFIPPKPNFPSWVLDEDTCIWKPPVPFQEDGKIVDGNMPANNYTWDESTTSWAGEDFETAVIVPTMFNDYWEGMGLS